MNANQISGPGPPFGPAGQHGTSDRLVTGSSCRALKTAVSALYSLDDFVQEKIGSGFFSEVFKVTHRTTGQVMVLKMNQLRSNRPNMLREVQLLNKFSHSNILRFMGVCVHEGQLHALTEYISDGSLEQLVQNEKEVLPPSIKVRLALGIAKGMNYVHDYGVFHRDLTSKNVLIRRTHENQLDAVVGDFGLAAKIPEKCGKNRLDTVGSPYWMSPECLKGQWYDQTSDIFSYGIILCELIARIDADPDILPRTDSFGLDYLTFVELCPNDTPPALLRLAFYSCTYDPKSRPKFSEIVKKLTSMSEKIAIENGERPILQCFQNNINFINDSLNSSCISVKRNSIDANYSRANSSTGGSSEEENETIVKLRSKCDSNEHAPLQHRRSLSENVIFPQHTTPSDKARCHIMNRTTINNGHQQIIGLVGVDDSPTYSNITLRKVAETMFLKDPQYKPRVDQTKSNPFTALAQLKGVKKLLGANPGTYTTGVGDLFSSCFEMSSPLLRQLSTERMETSNGDGLPKSLPNSPGERRKEYKIDGATVVASTRQSRESTPNTKTFHQGHNNKLELDLQKSTGTIKKYKVNSLFSHPLFKSGQSDNEEFLMNGKTKSGAEAATSYCNANGAVCSAGANGVIINDDPNLRILNRRGSTESGFFSCLNEDFSTYKPTCSCFDKYSNQTLNDSSSIFMMDGTLANTAVSSLRSLDDLELSESRKRCRHIDLDTRSIDLINRLALDSEINNFIQKNQFSNQLLYCKKNRTSSIYTDSSDDISSLAGSDSLLWDDRSYTTTSSTRSASAQIAKIVEYFERQGQTFKNFHVPEATSAGSSSSSSGLGPTAFKSTLTSPHPANSSAASFHRHCSYVDYTFPSSSASAEHHKHANRTAYKLNNRTSALSDYEAFCMGMELDKKSSQQRLMICEGAVRSKLLLFDKLNQAAANSTQKE